MVLRTGNKVKHFVTGWAGLGWVSVVINVATKGRPGSILQSTLCFPELVGFCTYTSMHLPVPSLCTELCGPNPDFFLVSPALIFIFFL